jgi:pimeloyl-ACP methyl ester carboxylesterase
MATFVVAHGAWSAGWAWKKMHPLMAVRGHRLITPTYTGLGERSHLASPDVDLDTHITDIVNVLEWEDLTDVNLVGHSYGGMVATGVADRARPRIARLIYVDAFAPRDGESAFDIMPAATRAQRANGVDASGFIPPSQLPPDTAPEDVTWSASRRMPHSLKAFAQKIALKRAFDGPRHYILCPKHSPDQRFRPFYDRAKAEHWAGVYELDSSHNPHVTVPSELADLLDKIARA